MQQISTPHRATLCVIFTAILLSVSGCGESKLESITLSPTPVDIPMGITKKYSAIGHYSNGSQHAIIPTSWSSGIPSIATVSDDGSITAQRIGSTTITILYNEFSTQVPITVSNTVLQTISVTADHAALGLNATQQMHATGTYSDGSTREHITRRSRNDNDYVYMPAPEWESSEPSVATIDDTGVITMHSNSGKTIISATVGDIVGKTEISAKSAAMDSVLQ